MLTYARDCSAGTPTYMAPEALHVYFDILTHLYVTFFVKSKKEEARAKKIVKLPCEGAAGLLLFMEALDWLLVGEAVKERSGDETEAVVAVDEVEFIFLTWNKKQKKLKLSHSVDGCSELETVYQTLRLA